CTIFNGATFIVIANVGAGNAPSFVLRVNGSDTTINGLAAGQSTTVNFRWINGAITAIVDPNNLIAENDETNNSTTLMIPTFTTTRIGKCRATATATPSNTPTNTPRPTSTFTPSFTPIPDVTAPPSPIPIVGTVSSWGGCINGQPVAGVAVLASV